VLSKNAPRRAVDGFQNMLLTSSDQLSERNTRGQTEQFPAGKDLARELRQKCDALTVGTFTS
jgi:hypothetical protein